MRAKAIQASYLLMGAYSHSRIGEYVFGGVTRTMIAESTIPLLLGR